MSIFEIKEDFYIDNEKVKLISGALHYFRVVPEYWLDRLEKLKALGCNTVETYIPWNIHEPKESVFNFCKTLSTLSFSLALTGCTTNKLLIINTEAKLTYIPLFFLILFILISPLLLFFINIYQQFLYQLL